MRLAWGGLAARITLTLVLGLAAAQVSSFLLFYFLRSPPSPPIGLTWVSDVAEAHLAGRVAPGAETWVVVRVSDSPPDQDDRASPRLERLRERLVQEIGPLARRVVLTGDDRPLFAGPMPFFRFEGERGPPPPDSRGAPPDLRGPVGEGRGPPPGEPRMGWRGEDRDAFLPHDFTLGVQRADGAWLHIRPRNQRSAWGALLWPLLSLSAAGIVVAGVSIWWSRRLMAPLGRLTEAAQRLGLERLPTHLGEDGPPELRSIARAFNEMSTRLTRFVSDRTQMVAAISHDLRTPLTRLRLRAEDMADPGLRERLLRDVNDMEVMIEATLSFARQESDSEPSRLVDLAVLLQSLCDDRADAGEDAVYEGPLHLTLRCQPVALKRALDNLIGNACQHGSLARVTLAEEGDAVLVRIADAGPGIPPERVEEAFAPFRRLEASRNRATGGVGLGLSVARTIVRAHGGDVTLENRPVGGLLATVRLPKAA